MSVLWYDIPKDIHCFIIYIGNSTSSEFGYVAERAATEWHRCLFFQIDTNSCRIQRASRDSDWLLIGLVLLSVSQHRRHIQYHACTRQITTYNLKICMLGKIKALCCKTFVMELIAKGDISSDWKEIRCDYIEYAASRYRLRSYGVLMVYSVQ